MVRCVAELVASEHARVARSLDPGSAGLVSLHLLLLQEGLLPIVRGFSSGLWGGADGGAEAVLRRNSAALVPEPASLRALPGALVHPDSLLRRLRRLLVRRAVRIRPRDVDLADQRHPDRRLHRRLSFV